MFEDLEGYSLLEEVGGTMERKEPSKGMGSVAARISYGRLFILEEFVICEDQSITRVKSTTYSGQ